MRAARLAIVARDVDDAARNGGSDRLLVVEGEQLLGRAKAGAPVDAVVPAGRERVEQDAASVRLLRVRLHALDLTGEAGHLAPPLDRTGRDAERLGHPLDAPAAAEHPSGCQLLLGHGSTTPKQMLQTPCRPRPQPFMAGTPRPTHPRIAARCDDLAPAAR